MNETVQCITSDGRAGNDVVNGGVARVSEKGVVRAITYRTSTFKRMRYFQYLCYNA